MSMDHLLGLLRVHIHRGVNLAIRDLRSSDPYVIIRMGKQKLKTGVVKKNLNPVWDEDLTLSVMEPLPVKLEVYDRDLFSLDDKMGDAEFDFTPFLEAVKMRLNDDIPNNTIITTVKPTRTNCLAEESYITWTDGRVVQNMVLRLRNVECGEIEIKLRWIDVPGPRLDLLTISAGVNLASKDIRGSDPYIVFRVGEQEVYDKDTFSADDEMGDAELDIKPFLEALRMHLDDLPNETIIATLKPTRTNCIAEESYIKWTNGKVIQNMVLRLRNVVSGEIEIQLGWISVPGSKGL
ncbi:C2-domain ABA-related 4-like protein [Tanacetum coccineum]